MKKLVLISFILTSYVGRGQTLKDTIENLKNYSQHYLELLFNKRDIDSVMTFWTKGIYDELKSDYTIHKQMCKDDSTLKVLFANDMNTFYKRVTGKIVFFAFDDKEGVNIKYFVTPSDGYYFLITYDLFGDFESHNSLMRTFLLFTSNDKGKTWILNQDGWIQDYMKLYYYKRDYYGRKSSN